MEAILSRLKHLTDEGLRQEFLSAGLKCGPITGTTRGTFERKLARKLLESQAPEAGETETDRPSSDEARGSPTSSSSSSNAVDVVTCEGSQNSGECDAVCTQEQKQTSSPPPGLGSPQEGGEKNRAEESQSSRPKAPTHYYGVCPPLDSPGREDTVHVYTEQKKALDAVLRMKGARFKVFACREDAEKFATAASEDSSPLRTQRSEAPETSNSVTHSALNVEKANEFKSPITQDLTGKLRSAVEKGDEETFCQLVWENPRYLIGSADNPTIVQVGCRYNVLHVAAKENRPQMVQLVLETLENPEFMRLMYPDDQENMLWDRMHYIVDLYLNMPDKQNNETPLHFACKFGCPEVVNVLCSHPATDKEHRNKYNKKPASVICERKNKTKETKLKISEYLEDRFYVPLLRAADNTLQPVIGSPWSPSQGPLADSSLGHRHHHHHHHYHHGGAGTPRDPTMTLTAFAGPLTASKADEFHKLWKTPPRQRAKYFHGILKSDPERGAERVGRELAHERGYPWSEYWDFLDSFADLSVQEGLDILEAYLQCKSCSPTPTPWDTDEKKKTGVTMESCSAVAICNTTGNTADEEHASLHRHKTEGLTLDKDTPTSEKSLSGSPSAPVRNLLSKFDSVSTPGSSVSTNNNKKEGDEKGAGTEGSASLRDVRDLDQSDSGIEGLDQSESGLACSDQSKSEGEGEGEGLDLSNPGFWGSWWQMKGRTPTPDQVDGPDQSSTSSAEYQTADEDSGDGDELAVDTFCHGGSKRMGPSTGSTCSSSYKSVQSSGYLDTSSDHSHIFVGDSPTSLDNEVLSAMEGIQIDPQKYPSITQWRSAVEAYPAKQRQSWPHGSTPRPPQDPRSSTPFRKASPRFCSPAWLRRPGTLPPSPSYSTPLRPPGAVSLGGVVRSWVQR